MLHHACSFPEMLLTQQSTCLCWSTDDHHHSHLYRLLWLLFEQLNSSTMKESDLHCKVQHRPLLPVFWKTFDEHCHAVPNYSQLQSIYVTQKGNYYSSFEFTYASTSGNAGKYLFFSTLLNIHFLFNECTSNQCCVLFQRRQRKPAWNKVHVQPRHHRDTDSPSHHYKLLQSPVALTGLLCKLTLKYLTNSTVDKSVKNLKHCFVCTT